MKNLMKWKALRQRVLFCFHDISMLCHLKGIEGIHPVLPMELAARKVTRQNASDCSSLRGKNQTAGKVRVQLLLWEGLLESVQRKARRCF